MTSVYFEQAHNFLIDHLLEGVGTASEQNRRYRYHHCLRVAAIGRAVAEAEGLDADRLELACLLHDIGKFNSARPVDHGRTGAKIVRPFLTSLGMASSEVEEICQGIAMHTDGLWNTPEASPDYTGTPEWDSEPSILARCVGDCDNVDRYGTYRIHDTMTWWRFHELTIPEQLERIENYLAKIERERAYTCATPTCQRLWERALDEHHAFFTQLHKQISTCTPYLPYS